MAKKDAAKKTQSPKKSAAPKAGKPRTTAVRNSAVPKASKAAKAIPAAAAAVAVTGMPTYEQIAKRAYEIYATGAPGSETDHWHQAERELRGV